MNKDKTVTVIDHITLDRLQQLKVCIACQIFFCEWSGANIIEKIISLNDESLLQILKTNYQASVTNENKYNSFCEILNQNYMLFQNKTSLCSCCLGCNDMSYVKELAIKICKLFHEKIEQKERIFLFIELTIPPIIDIFRVIVRTLGTRNTRKSSSFPIFDHIILKMLSIELLRLSDNLIEIKSDIYESVHHIIINGIIYNQLEFYDCIFGNSIIQKKTKRMRMELSNDTLDNSIINRVNVDRGLLQMKDYNKDSILNDLGTKFSSFVETDLHQRMHFDITHNISPIYILGRYLKYSRDLPQSPWLVGETREMKSSIEDIIGSAIKLVLHNESSKLHGCGREDIDVRCLGNGRPFVMEINKALYELSSEKIDQIMNLLKDKDQVNIQGHLSITWMKQVNRSVWESMQQLAEEKKKGYCCLVWTEKSITQEDLNYLGSISSSIHGIDIDEDGRHCLKVCCCFFCSYTIYS